jgi:hypothetical protein
MSLLAVNARQRLALGMEVWSSDSERGDAPADLASVVVAQQRAEVVGGAQGEFAIATAAWIAAAGFAEVVVTNLTPKT